MKTSLEQKKQKKIKKLIAFLEKLVLRENRWDTWHVGGVRGEVK